MKVDSKIRMMLVAPQTSDFSHFFRQNSKFSPTEISGKNGFDALDGPRAAKNESQLLSRPRTEKLCFEEYNLEAM